MMRTYDLLVVVLATFFCAKTNAGVINEINFGDFDNPKVLDFETVAPGSISGTDQLFTDFGILEVGAVGSDFSDSFGDRNNASRALWFDDSGLVVVDPGDGGFAADEITYTLDFDSPQMKFGIGWHDQEDDMLFEFFSGALPVGSITSVGNLAAGGSSPDDFRFIYLSNTDPFDRVAMTNATGFGGFAVDDITLEGKIVPEPTSFATWALLGVVALAAARQRRSRFFWDESAALRTTFVLESPSCR